MSFKTLNERIINCRCCPRLVAYRAKVAREKRRAFMSWEYWGKPVPGFGDPEAELLILGLAPAAHGANRTGRMFTGDRSGDFLCSALHEVGIANQPSSTSRDDGLVLKGAFITAIVRCAPPKNKPTRQEIRNCSEYLKMELSLLPKLKSVLALGKIAFDAYLGILQEDGVINSRAPYRFTHGASYNFERPLPALHASYHPSQQNTFTGRLTKEAFLNVLKKVAPN
jgi:uracil-DNA glycosylase family 4